MGVFSYLKCEVEFYIESYEANNEINKEMLAKMASDKGLMFGVESNISDSDILSVQLATTKGEEHVFDSSIYKYLLSVVLIKWVKGMKIISLSFSEEQQSIHQFIYIEERITIGKWSYTKRKECPENPETKSLPVIYFSSNDEEFNIEQVRKVYTSILVENINITYAKTKRTSSQILGSTTSETHEIVGIGTIQPEDSEESDVVSSSSSFRPPTLKIATTTFTIGDKVLNSDSMQDWSDDEVKELLKFKADLSGIDGLSLFLVAQELIDYEGDKLSKISYAASSFCSDNDFNIPKIAKLIVRWVYNNLLEYN